MLILKVGQYLWELKAVMGIWMIDADSDNAGKACLKDRQEGTILLMD